MTIQNPRTTSSGAENLHFIADVMLGRLAKRMRLLGFDVLYDQTLHDNEILLLSLEENRVILTRDKALAKRPLAGNHLFIRSDDVREQLNEVIAAFSLLSSSAALTRCSTCNSPLVPLLKRDAKDLVPPYAYERNDAFFQCPQCHRVYWQGTHVKRMALSLRKKTK